jgi:glycosyltransferase involved in cell wall biosynthesis
MKINFISNLPMGEISGGFSGMNNAAHEALTEIAEVRYVGPVNPPPSLPAKVASKIARTLGGQGDFFFFSKARLQQIARQVDALRPAGADLDFYHGFTSWSGCAPQRPYMAWSDCSFADYVSIYHPDGVFRRADIARICAAEAQWMKASRGIFLTSDWGRLRTQDDYGLADGLARSVGIFGAMAIPEADQYAGGRDFLFISTDYAQKNGPLCRQAMDLVWAAFPDARLKIIGAPPSAGVLTDPRVTYEGYFNKSNLEDLAAFTRHLATGFALLHPTSADITPLTVMEAAFHGCPSITADAFGIPEVTSKGAFAVLLQRPYSVEAVAGAMIDLLRDEPRYRAMRQKARDFTVPQFSRQAFKARLQAAVLEAMG